MAAGCFFLIWALQVLMVCPINSFVCFKQDLGTRISICPGMTRHQKPTKSSFSFRFAKPRRVNPMYASSSTETIANSMAEIPSSTAIIGRFKRSIDTRIYRPANRASAVVLLAWPPQSCSRGSAGPTSPSTTVCPSLPHQTRPSGPRVAEPPTTLAALPPPPAATAGRKTSAWAGGGSWRCRSWTAWSGWRRCARR